MIIENKNNAGKVKLFFLLVPFIFTLFVVLSILIDWFEGYSFLIYVGVLFVLVVIFLAKLKLRYVSFDIKKNNIILRYHGLGPITPSYNSIEFPVSQLGKYEITFSMFKLRNELILYRKTNTGVAKYPSVSLSAMGKKEIHKIEQTLLRVLKISNKGRYKK